MKNEFRIFITLISLALLACSDNSEASTISKVKENPQRVTFDSVVVINEVEERIDTLKVIQEKIDHKYKNSKIINLVQGDLNADGTKDVLVVASRRCEPNESVSDKSECYRLVIFLADGKNKFRFKLDNETVLDCSDCQRSDPDVKIDNGVISIITSYGACKRDIITSVYKFNKQDESWQLATMDKLLLDCEQDPITKEPKTTQFPTATVEDFGLVKL